ncbi:MAG: hypothetical protein KHZ87_04350 [Clostridiales bacterium]|nr:hypothetical protein [Clostridiales bacterium]
MSVKEKKEDEIRKKAGFVPEYSDFYFKRKNGSMLWYAIFSLFALFVLNIILRGLLLISSDFFDMFILFIFVIIGWGVYHFIKKAVMKSRKHKGTFLEDTGTVRKLSGRREIRIPYIEWKQAFQTGNFRSNKECYEFNCKGEILRFYYEVGDSKAQKHIQECYKTFGEKIGEELPPLTSAEIGLFDRKYFYKKKYRSIFLTWAVIYGIAFAILASDEKARLIGGIILGLINGVIFYNILATSQLYYKNASKLNTAFKKYNKGYIAFKWGGWIVGVIAIVLMYLANYGMLRTIL